MREPKMDVSQALADSLELWPFDLIVRTARVRRKDATPPSVEVRRQYETDNLWLYETGTAPEAVVRN